MPIRMLPGNNGTTLTVVDVDGHYFPVFGLKDLEEKLRSIPSWQARNDDILICAYPRSGTHWMWEMVCMITNKTAERIPFDKDKAMLEVMVKDECGNKTSQRVLNSHLRPVQLPKDLVKRKCKIIYVMRNPKDVAVSFFNFHNKILDYDFSGSWNDYFLRHIKGDVDYGSWFDHTLMWENFMKDNPDYPIFVTTYEDMKEDSVREVTRIAKFLELDFDQSFIQEVTDLCHFDRMKKEKTSMELVGNWKDNEPAMYRKGEVGDWKNWFTVAQNEEFDHVYQEKMKDSKVQPRYTI